MILPTPAEWLQEQLDRRHWTQNEFARYAGIAQSAVTRFTSGTAGCDIAIRIANALNVSPALTLALLGKTPPPPSMQAVETETLAYLYTALDEAGREQLMLFADYLRTQQTRR